MKINLLLVESKKRGCLNKDLAGGMGTRTIIGNSLPARILEWVKTKNVCLPLISLAYLAAIFNEKGHQVEYSENEIKDADLFLIPSSIVDYQEEIKYAKKIREKNKKAKIGFFGPFASIKPDIFLEVADFVIQGEPESAVLTIAENGKIPQGLVKSETIQDLDKLPFPYWQIFPLEKYSYSPVIKRKNFVTILTSRGCPFSCGFYCPYALSQGKKWRSRSVPNIISEMKYLVKNYQVRGLDFRDPNFTLDKERVRKLALAMIKNKLDFEWSCETHLNVLDEDLLQILYKAGLRNINVGIESADDSVLQKSFRQKGIFKHQEKILKFCDKIGISVAAFYILGYDGDNPKTVEKTIRYAQKLNTIVAQFTICTPYPGTEFYKQVEEKITTKNWEDFNAYTPVFKHSSLTSGEILKFKEKAWVNYYFRPKYLTKFLWQILKIN